MPRYKTHVFTYTIDAVAEEACRNIPKKCGVQVKRGTLNLRRKDEKILQIEVLYNGIKENDGRIQLSNGWFVMAHGQAVVLFFFAVLLHSRLALLGRGYGTAQGVRNQSGVPTAACHGALPRFWKIKQNKYYMRCMCVFLHGTLSMARTT